MYEIHTTIATFVTSDAEKIHYLARATPYVPVLFPDIDVAIVPAHIVFIKKISND